MKITVIATILLIAVSCKSSEEKIFEALREDQSKLIELTIDENFKYTLTIDDSVSEEGQAQLTTDKLMLSPKPENSSITLIHNREYKIIGNRLCRLTYVQLSNDSMRSELVAPIEVIQENECFEIIEPFKK